MEFVRGMTGALLGAALLGGLAIVTLFRPAVWADETVWPEDAIGMEMTTNTLEGFRFQGLRLATPLADFQRKFPKARADNSDVLDRKAGLTVYSLANLKSADSAQFYFFAGRLYQMDIEFKESRIQAQGGTEAVVRRLVKLFGNPDNAYGNRRTWHQPTCSRRADYYASREGGRLIVTDTSVSSLVETRQKRTALAEDVELGF